MPYSCQLQLGTSGRVVTPVGGTSTCRGMARAMSHTSTFTMVQITTRSPFGKCNFGRSTIAEYFARSLGRVISNTTFRLEVKFAFGACRKGRKRPRGLYQARSFRVNCRFVRWKFHFPERMSGRDATPA